MKSTPSNDTMKTDMVSHRLPPLKKRLTRNRRFMGKRLPRKGRKRNVHQFDKEKSDRLFLGYDEQIKSIRTRRLKMIATELSSALSSTGSNLTFKQKASAKIDAIHNDEKSVRSLNSECSDVLSNIISSNADDWIDIHKSIQHKGLCSILLSPLFSLLIFFENTIRRCFSSIRLCLYRIRICGKLNLQPMSLFQSSNEISFSKVADHNLVSTKYSNLTECKPMSQSVNTGSRAEIELDKEAVFRIKRVLNPHTISENINFDKKKRLDNDSLRSCCHQLREDFESFQSLMISKLSEEVAKTRTTEYNLHLVQCELSYFQYHNIYLKNRLSQLEIDSELSNQQIEKYRKCFKMLQNRTEKAEHECNLMRRTSAQICSETNTLCLQKENELAYSLRENKQYLQRIHELEAEVDSLVELLYKCEEKLIFYEQQVPCPSYKCVESEDIRKQDPLEHSISNLRCEKTSFESPFAKQKSNERLNMSMDSITESPGEQAKLALVDCIKDMDSFEKRFCFEDDQLEVDMELRKLMESTSDQNQQKNLPND